MTTPHQHVYGHTIVDRTVRGIGVFARVLAVLMVLLQFSVVVARYLFDAGSVMAQEGILMLFGAMFMLALADALGSDRHVRVDMLYYGMSSKKKRLVDAVGIVVLLLPLTSFMIWKSWGYVAASWASFEGSREAAGLPGVFLFKTIIPVALILLILQALSILFRSVTFKEQSDD